MKKIATIVFACFSFFILKAQHCEVETEALKGTYEGDCKKGKANGRGTASGKDSYTGEFKSGYPEGNGKYTWKNGDWYEGAWKKGVMEGQGVIHYAGKEDKDSVQTGFWKKGKYIGKYEKPFEVHGRTPAVTNADIKKTYSGSSSEITFTCESITGGAFTRSGQVPKPVITNVDVVTGQFQTQTNYDNMPKTSVTTFRGVAFPLRLRVYYGSDMIDVEIFEAGNWAIDLRLQR